MAKDLKKFVNLRFTKTIDLAFLRQLFERHRADLRGLDLALFDGDAGEARRAVQDFFAGPEENYPYGLVADLHRIAELGSAGGLEVILAQAARLGISLSPSPDDDRDEVRQDPKHVALRVFLEHPALFDAASDMMTLLARTSLAEFAGSAEGVEAVLDDETKQKFEQSAGSMFESDLRGRYCRVGWYDDDDDLNLVVTYGSTINTTPIVAGGEEKVISFRAAEHAVLTYTAMTGLLKIGGVAKALQHDMAELFAVVVLGRPGFFAAEDAQNLYTLDPIHRSGFGFTFSHAFDPGIQRVQIVEAQVDRFGADPRSGETRTFYSYVARDSRDNALARLGERMRGEQLGADWRLNHIIIRVHFVVTGSRPAKVTVKLKPRASAMFKRQRFEGRIMTLLRRNGLVHERDVTAAAVAAE